MTTTTHLAATVRVLQSHLGQRKIRADAAAEIVRELALRLVTDDAASEDRILAQKLELATGQPVAGLVVDAEGWA